MMYALKTKTLLLVIGSFLLCGTASSLAAAETLVTAEKRQSPTAYCSYLSFFNEPTKPKKPRGRVPNYYGKVDLSAKQRTSIYKIQGTYQSKIEQLEKQLVAMREKRDKEVHDVLSDKQKERLKTLLDAARKKREERQKKKEPVKKPAT